MKPIWLLLIIFIIFAGYGFTRINLFTATLYAPPGMEAPIELLYGSPGNLISAPRTLFESERRAGEFRYEFSVPSGAYPVLLLVAHGSAPASSLVFRDVFHARVLEIQNPACVSELTKIEPTSGQSVSLPSQGRLQLVLWMIFTGWPCFLLTGLIYLAREFCVRSPRFEVFKRTWRDSQTLANSPFWRAAILMILFLSLLFLIPGGIRYDLLGDDPAMELLASGYITGHPSEYLVFIHFLPGLALKAFYSLFPSIPWYPAMLVLAVGTGIFIATYGIQRSGQRACRLLWGGLFLGICGVELMTHLQFTSSAFFLGFGGVLLFILQTSTRSLVLSFLFVVACSLLRYESFVLLTGTFSLAAIYFTRRSWRTIIPYGLIVIVSVLGLKEMNVAYYLHDPGWAKYFAYNQARGELHQTPKLNDIPAHSPVFKAVGWSANDREMFDRHWLFQDDRVYSIEKLRYLGAHLAPVRDFEGGFFTLLASLVRLPGVVLFLLVVFTLGLENGRSFWKNFALILAPTLVLFSYFALYLRLPDRVVLPILCACTVLLLIQAPPSIYREHSLIRFICAVLLIAITLNFSISTNVAAYRERALASRQLHHSFERLRSIEGMTFVNSIHAIRLENLEPFGHSPLADGLDIIPLLWLFESPSYNLWLERHHSRELFPSLAHDPHFLLLVPTAEMDRGQAFSTFMLEHYGENIRMRPFTLPDGTPAIFPDLTVLQLPGERP